MEIIKIGDLSKTTIVFECPRCGCVFRCDMTEVQAISSGRDVLGRAWIEAFICQCPTCKTEVCAPGENG